jgi:hypothetical protein
MRASALFVHLSLRTTGVRRFLAGRQMRLLRLERMPGPKRRRMLQMMDEISPPRKRGERKSGLIGQLAALTFSTAFASTSSGKVRTKAIPDILTLAKVAAGKGRQGYSRTTGEPVDSSAALTIQKSLIETDVMAASTSPP